MAILAKGSNRILKAAIEAVYGTQKTDGYHTLPFDDTGVKTDNSLVESNTITGSRFKAKQVQGLKNVAGPISVPVDEQAFGFWLNALFGAKATTGSGPYTHVFTPGSESRSLSLEIGYSDISKFAQFDGLKVNSMGLEFTPGSEIIANMDCVGKEELALASSTIDGTTQTYVTEKYQVANMTLSKDSVALPIVTTVSMNISNNLETSIYCTNGGGYREYLPEGMFMVSGEMTVLFDDTDGVAIYNDALAGTEVELTIALTGTSTNTLTFQLDEILMPQVGPEASGQAPVTLSVPFEAFYQNGAEGAPLKVTMVNDTADYTS